MKVCTDACLLGAWVANKMETEEIHPQNILDIGCGTGLLSLMLAQKSAAQIDAVEINADAFLQAEENISLSTWKDRITVHQQNILSFKPKKKYELIICNPPFFEKQLASPLAEKNAAMHDASLTFSQLAGCLKTHLTASGFAAILLPYYRTEELEKQLAGFGLYTKERLNISHSPDRAFFRTVLWVSSTASLPQDHFIAIKDETGVYTSAFSGLLKDYYL